MNEASDIRNMVKGWEKYYLTFNLHLQKLPQF